MFLGRAARPGAIADSGQSTALLGQPTALLWINRALESLWILTIVLVPLAFLGRSYGEWSSVIGSFELPKIVLLRTLVGLMAAFWLVEWGLSGGFPFRISTNRESWQIRPAVWLSGARNWLRTRPTRWVIVAAAIFLATTLLSTILSASWRVSLWGDVPGQDSYSAYTVAAYVLLFAIIATHLKTSSQLWRLIGAIVLMGVLVAGYAVLQHYGHDFLDLMEPPGKTRTSSTLGNPIFAGSLLLMTIPISLVAVSATIKEPLRTAKFWWKQGLWALVLTVQSMGIIFTLSRGPWFGTILAVAALLIMAGVFVGWRTFARVALTVALAAGLTTVLILLLPHTETEAVSASSPSEDYLTVLAGQRQWIATTNFAGCPGRPPDSFANSAVLTTSAKVPDALGWPIDPCFPVQIDPKAEQFEQVVACADQRPFAVHLLQSPQQELPKSPALLDLAEYRLHSLHPQSVALPTPPGL